MPSSRSCWYIVFSQAQDPSRSRPNAFQKATTALILPLAILHDGGTISPMSQSSYDAVTEEERLVAELALLGIRYLSHQSPYQARQVRPPELLLVDLVRQPSARVRAAIISVLLAHPQYAGAVPAALEQLQPVESLTLQLFYTAAVLLQQEYAGQLRPFLAARQQRLPDLFSVEFGLPLEGPPRERLALLGRVHRQRTATAVNWTGTYENAVHHLLRRWELEQQWNR